MKKSKLIQHREHSSTDIVKDIDTVALILMHAVIETKTSVFI